MKFVLSIFLLLFVYSFNAQELTTENNNTEKKTKKKKKEAITFKTYIIERNGISFGSDETFTFEFKNNGKTPVIITSVGTSCGCTTASKPEKPINPKEKGVISVKYDTKRVGAFTKEITVSSNVTQPIKLTIKGSVNPEGIGN